MQSCYFLKGGNRHATTLIFWNIPHDFVFVFLNQKLNNLPQNYIDTTEQSTIYLYEKNMLDKSNIIQIDVGY